MQVQLSLSARNEAGAPCIVQVAFECQAVACVGVRRVSIPPQVDVAGPDLTVCKDLLVLGDDASLQLHAGSSLTFRVQLPAPSADSALMGPRTPAPSESALFGLWTGSRSPCLQHTCDGTGFPFVLHLAQSKFATANWWSCVASPANVVSGAACVVRCCSSVCCSSQFQGF